MSKQSPWSGGPNVTAEEFEQHLKEQEEKRKEVKKDIPIHFLGPEDDIVEFLADLFERGGANNEPR